MNTITPETSRPYNFSKSCKIQECLLTLSFHIDLYDIVHRFDFRGLNVETSALAKLQEFVQGQKIAVILGKETDSFDLYLFLLKESLREYKHPYLRTNEKQNLVCRCFNVSQGEIERVVKKQNLRDIHQVTGSLKAGGGCTRCLGDIKRILMDIHCLGEHF